MRTVLLFFAALPLLKAQTPEQDLSTLLEPLLHAKHIYYENTYYYYEEGASIPSDTFSAIFHRSGAREYVQLGNMEILETGNLTVVADHEERVVGIQKPVKSETINKLFDPRQLEVLVETRRVHLQYGAANDGNAVLLITDPDRPKEKMTIRYDPMARLIREVVLVVQDPYADPFGDEPPGQATIVARFARYTTAPQPFRHNLSEYIQKKGDRYIAVGKCKGYSVL
jgi:hypothetical protein